MSRLVVVGSGTVVPEGDRGGSSFFVEGGGVRALLDCGPGAVQSVVRHGVPWDRLTHLVLTHFHGDHVGALPGLFFGMKHGILPAREEELTVLGPPGTRALFEGLAGALGDYFLEPGFPVTLEETPPGTERALSEGVRLSTRKTPHTEESQALRLDLPGGSMVYTGDTGPDPELGDFAHGVDVLVCECSLTDDEVGDNHLSPTGVARLAGRAPPGRLHHTHRYPHGPAQHHRLARGVDVLVCECSLTDDEVGDNHLSPTGVARIAGRADPGLLLLTHVYPHVRDEHDVPALVAAAGWAGRTELAADGVALPLG